MIFFKDFLHDFFVAAGCPSEMFPFTEFFQGFIPQAMITSLLRNFLKNATVPFQQLRLELRHTFFKIPSKIPLNISLEILLKKIEAIFLGIISKVPSKCFAKKVSKGFFQVFSYIFILETLQR